VTEDAARTEPDAEDREDPEHDQRDADHVGRPGRQVMGDAGAGRPDVAGTLPTAAGACP
jgi:hypothetical protein